MVNMLNESYFCNSWDMKFSVEIFSKGHHMKVTVDYIEEDGRVVGKVMWHVLDVWRNYWS